jgi:DNA-binding transcriptional MerR regulator
MKTGELATRFKLDPKTVKAWTDEFPEFFSSDAQGIGRTQRFYHPEDQITLNTIRLARGERRSSEEIRAMLAAGERNTEMPAEFAVIKGDSAVTVMAQMRSSQLQIEAMQAELEALRDENRRLREGSTADTERLLNEKNAEIERLLNEKNLEIQRVVKEASDEYTNRFTQQIAQLHEQIGSLKTTIQMLKERYNAE